MTVESPIFCFRVLLRRRWADYFWRFSFQLDRFFFAVGRVSGRRPEVLWLVYYCLLISLACSYRPETFLSTHWTQGRKPRVVPLPFLSLYVSTVSPADWKVLDIFNYYKLDKSRFDHNYAIDMWSVFSSVCDSRTLRISDQLTNSHRIPYRASQYIWVYYACRVSLPVLLFYLTYKF